MCNIQKLSGLFPNNTYDIFSYFAAILEYQPG